MSTCATLVLGALAVLGPAAAAGRAAFSDPWRPVESGQANLAAPTVELAATRRGIEHETASADESGFPASIRIEAGAPEAWQYAPRNGIVLDSGLVLTARHVVEGESEAYVNLGAGGVHRITSVVAEDFDSDWIVLRVEWNGVAPAGARLVESIDFRVDNPVVVASWMLDGFRESRGALIGTTLSGRGPGGLSVRVPGEPGMSGSGVYNAAGEVVGVLSSGIEFTSWICDARSIARSLGAPAAETPLDEWGASQVDAKVTAYHHASAAATQPGADPEASLKVLESALAELPENATVWNWYNYTLWRARRWEEALAFSGAKVAEHPASADALGMHGDNLARNSLYAPAIDHLERAVAIDPTAEALLTLAGAYLSREDRVGAVAAATRAIDLDPECFEAHAGAVLMVSRLDPEAGRHLADATARRFAGVHVLALLAQARSLSGQNEEASQLLAAFEAHRERSVAGGASLLWVGMAYGKLGRWEEAVAALVAAPHTAVAERGSMTDAVAPYAAYALVQAQDYDRACEWIEKAMLARPNDGARYIAQLQDTARRLGEPRRVLEALRRYVLVRPSDAWAWRELGACSTQLGDRASADEAATQLDDLSPHDASAVRYLISRMSEP